MKERVDEESLRRRRPSQAVKVKEPENHGSSKPVRNSDCLLTRMISLSRNTLTDSPKKDEEIIGRRILKFGIENRTLEKAEKILQKNKNFSVIQAISMIMYNDPLTLQDLQKEIP